MQRILASIVMGIVVTAVSGCGKKESPAAPASTTPPASADAAAPAAADVTAKVDAAAADAKASADAAAADAKAKIDAAAADAKAKADAAAADAKATADAAAAQVQAPATATAGAFDAIVAQIKKAIADGSYKDALAKIQAAYAAEGVTGEQKGVLDKLMAVAKTKMTEAAKAAAAAKLKGFLPADK